MGWKLYPHYKSKSKAKAKRTYRKKKQQYGPTLTFNAWNYNKRKMQNLTRDVRYFKEVRTIIANTNGNFRQLYRPDNVENCTDWLKWAVIWEEYKVLNFTVQFFASAVGSESLQEANAPASVPGRVATFKRGNVVTWVDQGELDTPAGPDIISKLIIKPSARLINARDYHKRYINRPYGNPEWGRLSDDGQISIADDWQDSRIQIYGQDFTPSDAAGTQIYYYVMISYKVVFRGRQSTI